MSLIPCFFSLESVASCIVSEWNLCSKFEVLSLLCICSIQTGELISKTEAHKGPINRVRLSNGRNCLFTASSDQTAKVKFL